MFFSSSKSIARQFIIRILLFSMVLTAVLTAIQLYIDYKTGLAFIDEKVTLIEKTYLNSITDAVWEFDFDVLNIQIEGISEIPDLKYIEVKDKESILSFSGVDQYDNVVSHEFPLIYYLKDKPVNLGSLKIVFSLQGLYQRLWDKVFVIAVSQGVKTFLVSLFIFYIFYQLIGDPLIKISQYSKKLDSYNLDHELRISSKPLAEDSKNEIDQLVFSLNAMRQNFLSYNSELEFQAYHDSLTKLPNRSLLLDRLKQLIMDVSRSHEKIALLFIDIDHFKHINDSYGHKFGDSVLLYVSKRFNSVLRKNDTLCRIGGDEFVALTRLNQGSEDASILADKLLGSLSDSFELEGVKIVLNISVGVSVYPDDADSGDMLLRNADAALYKAKAAGRNNMQFYSPELTRIAEHRLNMESQIKHALSHNEFMVYYQPQIDISSGNVVGAEALVRWMHPEKGFMSPDEFISVAEQTGQIHLIDQWVLKHVASLMAQWTEEGRVVPKIAVNFSGRSFSQESISDLVANILSDNNCPSSKIELEITESHLLLNPEKAIRELIKLKDLGVSIAIDDFGTGYSSLNYLKDLPVNKLKIDKSFIDDVLTDSKDQSIVTAIIALGHSLGFELIAEGVETVEQRDYLLKTKCSQIQGYFYSKPLPESDFSAYLSSRIMN